MEKPCAPAVYMVQRVDLPPVMAEKIDWMVDQLSAEFGGQFEPEQIRQVLSDSASRLAASATVPGYIPLLAHKFARERLKAITRLRDNDSKGVCDVVFVSLSGGGRGQIAAALTTLLSDHQVSVHSAGTAVFAEIDPAVRVVSVSWASTLTTPLRAP